MWQEFLDILVWLQNFFLNQIFDSLITLLELIPVPQFILDLAVSANNIPPSVTYWLGVFEIDFAVQSILLALILRFTLRRIPFIG